MNLTVQSRAFLGHKRFESCVNWSKMLGVEVTGDPDRWYDIISSIEEKTGY